jgi:hypothetical protein
MSFQPPTCSGCSGPIEPELMVFGSDRCHACRDGRQVVRAGAVDAAPNTTSQGGGVRRQVTGRDWIIALVALVLLIVVIAGCAAASGGSGSSASFTLVVDESSCQESPDAAYVNCSIGVQNNGDSPGLPTVYALYRYNDSGQSYDQSDNGVSRESDPIPAHSIGYVYFSHSYNALQHDVLQVAVTLHESDDGWPYVRVADPSDINWPDPG